MWQSSNFRDGGMPMAALKLEIVQERPFSSLEEEALLNLMRTSDFLHRAFHCKTRNWGVTSTQYNVLRILRGAQPRRSGHYPAAGKAQRFETHPSTARPARPPRRVDADLRGRAGTLALDGSGHREGPARVAGALESHRIDRVDPPARVGPQKQRRTARDEH